jgi:citrate lyase alpha subunit
MLRKLRFLMTANKEFSHRAMRSGNFNLLHRMASKTMNMPKRNTTLATSDISDRSWYIVDAARVPTPRSTTKIRQNTRRGFGGEHFSATMLCLKVCDHPVLRIKPRLERAIIEPLP